MSGGKTKVIALRDHQRAAPAIRRAKAIGGLGGFGVAALVGFMHGMTFATVAERALVVGVAGNLVAWALAVLVWRRVLVAEAGAAAARARRRRSEAAEERA